jgi:valyl-tRNA synthetase
VVLKAKREDRRAKKSAKPATASSVRPKANGARDAASAVNLEHRRDAVTSELEAVEARIAEIDGIFASERYFENADGGEVQTLQNERASLEARLEKLMQEWERLETALG